LANTRSLVADSEAFCQSLTRWVDSDLFHKAGTKLLNCFYVTADVRREKGQEFFQYASVSMLEELSLERFLQALEEGSLFVDFDARTGHNHGTKFRLRRDRLPDLYSRVTEIV